jgi:FkbM family methyltransferase
MRHSEADVTSMPPPVSGDELDTWCRRFSDVFGAVPDASQILTLYQLASQSHDLEGSQCYRRILAAFDQQTLRTGFTVRWGPEDENVVAMEGFHLHLDRADVSVSVPVERGFYEKHLISFFKDYLREGMHVIDAGANIGLYTVLAAKLVGPSGKVWAFEPSSENCRLLLTSVGHNKLTNVSLQPVALGSERGYAHFISALGSNGGMVEESRRILSHPSCRIVPTARLDDFQIERVDLVKMDVEGAEGLLVKGAGELLERCRPVIATEFSEMLIPISGMTAAQFLDFFRARNYTVFVVDRASHRLVPVGDTDAFAAQFVPGCGKIEDLVLMP